jgi:transcriptional regulator with XRE-family HTH domain
VDDDGDPRRRLARRLRELRQSRWPGVKVTQSQLAAAFGASVPLISSWESSAKPQIPPPRRFEAYALFFATSRSIGRDGARLLDVGELTDAEKAERAQLRRELLQLRAQALPPNVAQGSLANDDVFESLNSGFWRFHDGRPVTIVCAQVPGEMLDKIPYSKPADPDYVALYSYADLDSLIELHGHIRAANPGSSVSFKLASQLASDDYTTHLVSLGGVDWNRATRSLFAELDLPVRQIPDWDSPEGPYFEVSDDGQGRQFRPHLGQQDGKKTLREDVALFARAINPFNRLRTATICSGMYAAGTYGAVRALTDHRFRDRNAQYARTSLADSETFCIISTIKVQNGIALTPDWTEPETRLFEWASGT